MRVKEQLTTVPERRLKGRDSPQRSMVLNGTCLRENIIRTLGRTELKTVVINSYSFPAFDGYIVVLLEEFPVSRKYTLKY